MAEAQIKSSKRIVELDLARSLAIMGLPFVHLYEEFELNELYVMPGTESLLERLACGFGANLFMIMMGMNVIFSSRSTANGLFYRGLRLLLYFFILNILRFVLPGLMMSFFGVEDAYFFMLEGFIASDILALAGLSLLILSFFKKYNIKPIWSLVLGLVMMGIDTVIPDGLVENEYVALFLGNFFRVDDTSYFPLLSWFIYPAIGYTVGSYFKEMQQDPDRKKRFYIILSGMALSMIFAYYAALKTNGISVLEMIDSQSTIYINDFLRALSAVLLSSIFLAIAYYVCDYLCGPKPRNVIVKISDAILIFYALQWIIIGWLECIFLAYAQNHDLVISDGLFAFLNISVFIVTLGLSLWINSILRAKNIKL